MGATLGPNKVEKVSAGSKNGTSNELILSAAAKSNGKGQRCVKSVQYTQIKEGQCQR